MSKAYEMIADSYNELIEDYENDNNIGLTHGVMPASQDPFYSESNIKYLEGIMQDIKEGKAHFAEHELIEVD